MRIEVPLGDSTQCNKTRGRVSHIGITVPVALQTYRVCVIV